MAAYIWLGLMIVFLVAEACCPAHLISIWFAVGSLVALLVSIMGGSIGLQVTLFLLVSCALLASLWPLVRKFLKPRVTATNVDAVLGSTGRVTAAIDNVAATGQVKLGAMYWTARSSTGEDIPEGTLVRADRVEGVKVFVTPVDVTANL